MNTRQTQWEFLIGPALALAAIGTGAFVLDRLALTQGAWLQEWVRAGIDLKAWFPGLAAWVFAGLWIARLTRWEILPAPSRTRAVWWTAPALMAAAGGVLASTSALLAVIGLTGVFGDLVAESGWQPRFRWGLSVGGLILWLTGLLPVIAATHEWTAALCLIGLFAVFVVGYRFRPADLASRGWTVWFPAFGVGALALVVLRRQPGGYALAAAWFIGAGAVLTWRAIQREARGTLLDNLCILAIVVLGLVGVDATLRFLPVTDPAGRALPTETELSGRTTADKVMGGRVLDPGELNAEPWGWWIPIGEFRMGEPSVEKPPGSLRLIVQGASSTQGFGVERDEDVWTEVLERALNQRLPYPVEVVNAGIASTTSFTMLMNYRECLRKYRHDRLLLYMGDNDRLYSRGPYTEREMFARMQADQGAEHRSSALNRTLSHSPVYRALAGLILDFAPGSGSMSVMARPRVPAVPLPDLVRNLEDYAALTREEGVRVALIGEASRADLSDYKREMKRASVEEGWFYADAQDATDACVAGDEDVFAGSAHLTVAGNRCLGLWLADQLLAAGFFPPEVKP